MFPYNPNNPSFFDDAQMQRLTTKVRIVTCSMLGGMAIGLTIILGVTR